MLYDELLSSPRITHVEFSSYSKNLLESPGMRSKHCIFAFAFTCAIYPSAAAPSGNAIGSPHAAAQPENLYMTRGLPSRLVILYFVSNAFAAYCELQVQRMSLKDRHALQRASSDHRTPVVMTRMLVVQVRQQIRTDTNTSR